MTIAVHISFTGYQKNTFTNFNYRCFTLLAEANPHDHFIFIFDKPFEPYLIIYPNITPVLLTPQIKNRLLQHYWYNYKIPRLLNKYNATVFVSGDCVCSLRTKVLQCMILYDLSFLQEKNLYTKSDTRYLKKYLKVFINKASQVIVTNAYLQTSLKTLFPESANKTTVINTGIDDSAGSNIAAKGKELKEKLIAGKEYFLFYGTHAASENTITMLKAFSIFKKWQKSNMQLLLLFSHPFKKNIPEAVATYKYKDDICIMPFGSKENFEGLVSAAYAAVYLPAIETAEPAVLYTLKLNVPLIARNNDICKNVYKDAALYTNSSEKDISEKMMVLYKDENLRNQLIDNGRLISAEYTWHLAADLLWQTIKAAAGQ